MEGGKSANYWPGFVDALTNVVIAMVFVIVVLAIALSFAAQMMGKKMADELVKAKAAVSAAASSAAAAPDAPTASSTESAPPTTLQTDTTIPVRARDPRTAATKLQQSDRSLKLEFADAALALDADATSLLHAALAPRRADAANVRVQIIATGPAMALSDNQRNAYIRVLAVRNELIDDGFDPDHIAVQIDTRPSTVAKPTVTVSFPPGGKPVNVSSTAP